MQRLMKVQPPPAVVVSPPESKRKKPTAKSQVATKEHRLAAAAAMQWLSLDKNWKQETISLLQLPKSLSESNGSKPETKRLLEDSLDSFQDCLSSRPLEVCEALDRLAGAGLNHPKAAKKLRSRMHSIKTNGEQLDLVNRTLLEAESELKTKLKSKKRTERKLKEALEAQAGNPESFPPRTTSTTTDSSSTESLTESPSSSFWGMMTNMLSRVLPFSLNGPSTEAAPEQAAPEKTTNDVPSPEEATRKKRSLQAKINAHQSNAETLQESINLLEKRISKHKSRRDKLQNLINSDDIEPQTKALEFARGPLCQAFSTHIAQRHAQMLARYQALDANTDLTRPHEWFPYARLDRRKIIYHGGPTNSGKTYEALERLKQAERGMYLAPLRLLAAEVYEKLTLAGVYCNLYTGQERREIPFATHGSATVEMASLTDEYDVVVLDEIQMMADEERGFAWTRALMGTRTKELHVCGGAEAKKIVQRIANACGDEFEFRSYKRFSPLNVATSSLAATSEMLGSYRSVQPGDCVVGFSRNDLFGIKREIEELTKYKCCVIYGSLPPQIRSEQARLFNDPDSGFDILVASDAIGMGLNLNIRRIIFNSVYKSDGSGIVQLDHSAIKQISGRAGRRNSPFPEGEVTCRDPHDMPHLRTCLATEISPIHKAGLMPTASHIEVFGESLQQQGNEGLVSSSHQDPNNINDILRQFNEMATLKSDFFLCRQTTMLKIARHLASFAIPVVCWWKSSCCCCCCIF